MAKSILRAEKGKGSAGDSAKHNSREKPPAYADWNHVKNNIDLTPRLAGRMGDSKTVIETQKQKIATIKEAGNRVVLNGDPKYQSVTYHDWVLSASPEYFSSEEKTKRWIEKTIDFIESEFESDNILSAHLHLDESTPHIQMITMPVTEDGRLCAKELYDPQKMRDLQTSYGDHLEDLGIKRGKKGSNAKHVSNKAIQKIVKEVKTLKNALQHKNNEPLLDKVSLQLGLDREQYEHLEEYQEEHGEEGLRMYLRDAVESKLQEHAPEVGVEIEQV